MPREHIHFVTGKLAEPSLRRVLEKLAPQVGFDYSVSVMGITVAALMTTDWLARRMAVPDDANRVLIPGYCLGDLAVLESALGLPVELGPKDLRDLPEHFGHAVPESFGDCDIEILAEINHAPRLTLDAILQEAQQLRNDGADVIDLGCNPGETWRGAADCVRALRDQGHRVSIDSYNPDEIEPAALAGAELVLSVNAENREHAADWGCEVVAVPDAPGSLDGLQETIDHLAQTGVPLRVDPILEPIGFGFAASLDRYGQARRLWPEAEMMMGVGNLTELTEVDSAGVNVLLLAFCQELGIRSILTTQVINWARSAVRECDFARRLVYHAVQHRTLPKHLDRSLVMLRDAKTPRRGAEELRELAEKIKDHNYRIFVEDDGLHLISGGLHLTSTDPFEILDALVKTAPKNLDAGHAFYLGYEMAKAKTALTLGKNYRQDESLDWGFLTEDETSHRDRRRKT